MPRITVPERIVLEREPSGAMNLVIDGEVFRYGLFGAVNINPTTLNDDRRFDEITITLCADRVVTADVDILSDQDDHWFMGIYVRSRRKLTPKLWLNFTKSGVSLSARAGRATVNTRGRTTVRIARGLFWRIK